MARNISFILVGLLTVGVSAQTTLDRQVIGSTGNFTVTPNVQVGSSVGEAVVFTGSSASYDLTQGFQQNTLNLGALMATATTSDETCVGAMNGSAFITSIGGCAPPYSVVWSTGETTMGIDSLSPGLYTYTVFGSGGCAFMDSVYVGSDPDCTLDIPNAFSPDGNDINDTWYIENIEQVDRSRVVIFNRWGDPIREIENYNNTDNAWDGTDSGNDLVVPGTYFYIIEAGPDNQFSGWVQVTY